MSNIKYRRGVITVIITTCFLGLSMAYSILFFKKISPTPEVIWINECLKKKSAYSVVQRTPKIVFSSGSNTLFGVRTKDIENYFKVPCVNLAVNVGLQIDYILANVKQNVKPGDIVILPLEFECYSWEGDHTFTKLNYTLNFDKDFFLRLPVLDQLEALFAYTAPRKFYLLAKDSYRGAVFFERKNGYQSCSLNANGDETINIGSKVKISELHEKVNLSTFKGSHGLNIIGDFLCWAERNNIAVIFCWPVIVKDKYQGTDDFKKCLISEFGINRVLGDSEDFVYAYDLFYDSAYHLNNRGVTYRTQKIISLLKKHKLFKNWLMTHYPIINN